MTAAHDTDPLEVRITFRNLTLARDNGLTEDVFRVERISGREAISELFTFRIDLTCRDRAGVDLDALAGAAVHLTLDPPGEDARHIHGIVTEVEDRLAALPDVRAYRIVVRPTAARLGYVTLSDVYLEMTLPEILQRKLALSGLGAEVEWRLRGEYPKREISVQIGESDEAFLRRWTEHLGIAFFFEQTEKKSALVLGDHNGAFREVPGRSVAQYRDRGEHVDVFSLMRTRKIVPRAQIVRDYNERAPHVDLTAMDETAGGDLGGTIEDGPHAFSLAETARIAALRAEEQRALQLVYTGESTICQLAAGGRFLIEGHPDLGDVDLIVTEVEHTLDGSGGGRQYKNRFRAIPADRTFRPARTTPKPKVQGLVTGLIETPGLGSDTRAQLDDEGRYWVRFLLDSTPRPGQKPSLPIRMLQPHVGEQYGIHFPLRPGTEVLVGFVNGDPDRPVIVGAAHNPLTPACVTNREVGVHRLRTQTGIKIDFVEDT